MELNNEYEEAREYLKRIEAKEACAPQRVARVEEAPSRSQSRSQPQPQPQPIPSQAPQPQQSPPQSQQHISPPSQESHTEWMPPPDLERAIQNGEAGVVDELVFSSDSDGNISDEEECIVVEHYSMSSDYRAERIPSKEDEYEIQVEEQSDSQEEAFFES